MDCFLCFCSSPERGVEAEAEEKNNSLTHFGYILQEQYAQTLCRLLDLPSTYGEQFLAPSIEFCLACTNFVGTVARLYEQLEEIQTKISGFKNQVQQRLLNCSSSSQEVSKSRVHVNACRPQGQEEHLLQKIIKNIQVRWGEANLESLTSETSFETGQGNCVEINLDNVAMEEEEVINNDKEECVDNGYVVTSDNCATHSNLSDEINEISSMTGSKRGTKRTWKVFKGKTKSFGRRCRSKGTISPDMVKIKSQGESTHPSRKREFWCKICVPPKSFDRSGSLRNHNLGVHGSGFVCAILDCRQRCSTPGSLRRHHERSHCTDKEKDTMS